MSDSIPKRTAGEELKPHEQQRLMELLHHTGRLLPEGTSFADFIHASTTKPTTALRVNTLIPASETLRHKMLAQGLTPSPWCADSFVLKQDERLGHSLEYALGGLYIQAKGPSLAVEVLDPQPGERILDLCSAPGGKTSQIAAKMNNSGMIVVNESGKNRFPALIGNLERCGVANAIITKAPGTILARYFHNYFDRILLDAPCSGDGTVCKDKGVLRNWSVEAACKWQQTQAGLLRAAFHMLKPGGTLVYSTCALATEENEDVVGLLGKRYPEQMEIKEICNFSSPPLPQDIAANYPDEFSKFVRVWPHLHNTEGAFVAKLGKYEATEWRKFEDDVATWPNGQTETGARQVASDLEEEWQFTLPLQPEQIITRTNQYLWLQPALTPAMKERFPYFIRGGVKLASRHRQYHYLTQQATTMLGHLIKGPHVSLNWQQMQSIFQNKSIQLEQPTELKGMVICRYGSWNVCRGQILKDQVTLEGMLPGNLRRPAIRHLFPLVTSTT